MGRKERVTKLLKGHDPKLFCEDREGTLCVFREGYSWQPVEFEGDVICFLRPSHHFVFALTDNWRFNGKPVDWGLIPILNRIKALDLWNRDLAGECELQAQKHEESFERDKRNSIESFFYEFRSQFKKTFNDVNVGSFKKTDRRRTDEVRNGSN